MAFRTTGSSASFLSVPVPPMRTLLLASLLCLTACDSGGLADRTYPGPGAYAEIEFGGLFDAEPNRYNLRAAVVEVVRCPEEELILCASEASLLLAADFPVPEDPAYLGAVVAIDGPDQFRPGQRGTFSLELQRSPTGTEPTFTLLGYALD